MTEIVVSRRDGIATGPDGVKYRVHRGKTLADATHPVVVANPGDWTPMRVELTAEAAAGPVNTAGTEVDDLRNELAEIEEAAERYGAELKRLAIALQTRGATLPAEDDQTPGWVVDLALAMLDGIGPAETVPAPKTPRGRGRTGPKLVPPSDDD